MSVCKYMQVNAKYAYVIYVNTNKYLYGYIHAKRKLNSTRESISKTIPTYCESAGTSKWAYAIQAYVTETSKKQMRGFLENEKLPTC